MSGLTGLALGGGGSRALCHLGVLNVLAEEGIRIDCIAGSSLGGMIAAMYAFSPDAVALRQRGVQYFTGSKLFAQAVSESQDPSQAQSKSLKHRALQATFLSRFFFALLRRPSLLLHNPIMVAAAELLPEADISTAEIPLACNALDMTCGKLCTFRKGNVRRAVVAGTSIASILPPHEWEGVIYADAAPVCAVPVRAARELGAEKVIAVDLRAPVERQEKFANGFEVFRRIEATSSRLLNDAEVAGADVVIRPEKVLEIFWADFTDVEKIVKIGEDATRAALPDIRNVL